MFQREGMLVVMTDVRPRKSIEKEVFRRVRSDVCIYHDTDEESGKITWCECAAVNLGLCSKHYQAYRRAIANKPIEEEAQIKTDLIRDGQVLPPQFVREIKGDNVFRRVARKVAG